MIKKNSQLDFVFVSFNYGILYFMSMPSFIWALVHLPLFLLLAGESVLFKRFHLNSFCLLLLINDIIIINTVSDIIISFHTKNACSLVDKALAC